MNLTKESYEDPVIIVGGGFAGLKAARKLGKYDIPVLLIDKQNYHVFQPLLYQVATAFLAPSDIASPLRAFLAKYNSVKVLHDEVRDINFEEKSVKTSNGEYKFKYLVLASGTTSSYFGNANWEKTAPGLKTLQDAILIRTKILRAFELAEQSSNLPEKAKHLTFLIVGGGPTGVELAGALAELTHKTMKHDFRNFNPVDAKIILCEGSERLLSTFHPKISKYALYTLEKIGVQVLLNTLVKDISENSVEINSNGATQIIESSTIIWAAGVAASEIAFNFKKLPDVELDKVGRIKVSADLSLPGYPNIFVVGDSAHIKQDDQSLVPGMAPAALQQGQYVAKAIMAKMQNKSIKPFRYFDKGNMAVIGKGKAVAEKGNIRITGFPAWLAWAFVHIYFLIEFENKIRVFLNWAWNYFTNKGGSRIISKSE